MSEIFDNTYFDQEYKLQAIWLGLIWWFLGAIPIIVFRAWNPGYYCSGFVCVWGLTEGEWHGFRVMQYGFGSAMDLLGLFWLLAYIK